MEHLYRYVEIQVRVRDCPTAAAADRAVWIVLSRSPGENSFLDWAKIVDCGDAPLTFLDNTFALKQLGRAHEVLFPWIST
jgi:hypothetical protein